MMDSLTAEQRRALAMLATSGHNGATQALLSAQQARHAHQ
jgi:hypothetical protein